MIIKTADLTREYHLGSSTITAVNKVNIEIADAAFVTIIGPSGSGKTTLLHLLGLNDYPTSGKIFFDGINTSDLSGGERRRIRLRKLGFIFQTFNLIPTLTALENVELPMVLAGKKQEEQRAKATQLLQIVGLENRLQHRQKELSAGEMQRVAIARALSNDPKAVLADEPTGELDSETGLGIVRLLSELCKTQKTTVIVATHDMRLAKVSDVTYELRDGQMTAFS